MSEGKKQRKPKEGRSWKQFWSFFRKVKLSWGWIILSLAVSIAYYAVVTMIPGSTAALYAGDFTTAAIMGLVINYAGTLVLSLASALSQLMADAKSVRAARNSVWKQMMGIETSYYSENDPGRLLSAVTSDTEAAVSALIRLIIGIPSLGIYLMMCMGQISAYHPKLLGVLFVLVPVYIPLRGLYGPMGTEDRLCHPVQDRRPDGISDGAHPESGADQVFCYREQGRSGRRDGGGGLV